MERQDLIRILDPRIYPRHKHQFILDMMCKFELCFAFEGLEGEQFLVSDLLSKAAPVTGEWKDALAFQYHYNVLPSSVISRFIVRMRPYLYVLMALAASSPFWREVDTGFACFRARELLWAHSYGTAPVIESWEGFGALWEASERARVFESFKDNHWEIGRAHV